MINRDLLNRNRNINRGYRKLIVWKEAIELNTFVKKKLNSLKSISFKVKAQIEDLILSVHLNIVEGHYRRHLKENIQFNTIALASLGENYSQVFSLLNSEDIDKEWFHKHDQLHYSLENKLIKLNMSLINKLNDDDWNKNYE